jgi:hypothetical protein
MKKKTNMQSKANQKVTDCNKSNVSNRASNCNKLCDKSSKNLGFENDVSNKLDNEDSFKLR